MPVIAKAERVLLDWLRVHAGATAAGHDTSSMRALRDAVSAEWPHLAHDYTAVRRESIRRALVAAGDDPALAEGAFEAFIAARQEVELYADVRPALARLSARVPIVAVTNGNADLVRTGVSGWFSGAVFARAVGVSKPDRRIFAEACRVAGCPAGEVLHVGDDAVLDVAGALDAGLQAAWVRRHERTTLRDGCAPHHVVADLLELCERLGG